MSLLPHVVNLNFRQANKPRMPCWRRWIKQSNSISKLLFFSYLQRSYEVATPGFLPLNKGGFLFCSRPA